MTFTLGALGSRLHTREVPATAVSSGERCLTSTLTFGSVPYLSPFLENLSSGDGEPGRGFWKLWDCDWGFPGLLLGKEVRQLSISKPLLGGGALPPSQSPVDVAVPRGKVRAIIALMKLVPQLCHGQSSISATEVQG